MAQIPGIIAITVAMVVLLTGCIDEPDGGDKEEIRRIQLEQAGQYDEWATQEANEEIYRADQATQYAELEARYRAWEQAADCSNIDLNQGCIPPPWRP
jgi:hypothetical protein